MVDLKHITVFGLGALAVIIVAMFMGGAMASNQDYNGSLTVSGTGYIYAVPDTAQFSAGVTTEATTSDKAMADNADQMNDVIAALHAAGIPDKDIQTSTVSLQPKYDNVYATPMAATATTTPTTTDGGVSSSAIIYPYPYPYQSKIVGYTATNSVIVTVDASKVGAALSAVSAAGANQVNGVNFVLSDEKSSAAYDDALKLAVNDATGKATAIANAAGVGTLKIKMITESSSYYQYPVYMDSASVKDVSVPVSPGQQKIQATVSITYGFAQ